MAEELRPVGVRQRVRQAIEGPVGRADQLLADLGGDADVATKLEILISGWGRGLSAALEELAIAVEDLQAPRGDAGARPAPRDLGHKRAEAGASTRSEPVDRSEADEEQLLDEARRSREETAEVGEQADELRREGGDEPRSA